MITVAPAHPNPVVAAGPPFGTYWDPSRKAEGPDTLEKSGHKWELHHKSGKATCTVCGLTEEKPVNSPDGMLTLRWKRNGISYLQTKPPACDPGLMRK